jgi:hypothetical protein
MENLHGYHMSGVTTWCSWYIVPTISLPMMHALHVDVAWAAREACRPGCRVTMCRRQSVHLALYCDCCWRRDSQVSAVPWLARWMDRVMV